MENTQQFNLKKTNDLILYQNKLRKTSMTDINYK